MAVYTIDNLKAPIDFECNGDPLKRTLQNAKNLLMCAMGEVPYDRLRGLDPAMRDMNMAELEGSIKSEVQRIMCWEPDVTVKNADAAFNSDGELVITCQVECTISE